MRLTRVRGGPNRSTTGVTESGASLGRHSAVPVFVPTLGLRIVI